ncbi:MAG: S41 family peptidase [Bacteroidia bacterium]|nr:S41 family peptidase [Bacteroidia bacterium]
MNNKIIYLGLVLVLLLAGFTSDISDRYFEIAKNMEIYGKVYTEINTKYVDQTSPTKLMRTGVDAMLKSLDPYTIYYGESQIEYSKLLNSGQYSGIGSEVSKQGEDIILVNMKSDGPADKAGLRVGDVLLSIDNETIQGGNKDINQIQTLLLGEKDTEVNLKVSRGGQELEFSVVRGGNQAQQEDVPYFGMVNDSVGYILQLGFTGLASQKVADAFRALSEKAELKALILDLRGNLGGRLDQAVDICNHFIPSGQLIVEMRGRTRETQNKFFTKRPPLDKDIPLAVLVNGRSASAAEIVSGAIQDLDRGVVIGSRSFGKGLVQNFRPLSYNTQMKITVAKYYTPSGRCIQAIDYANRKADGSVGKIPDSLATEFQTKNGRKVYDGGGVDPDILVEKEELAPITLALKERNVIFDFATEFKTKNDSIPGPRDFDISDELYQEFVSYVRGKDFSFETNTEKKITRLKTQLNNDGYEKEMETILKDIQQKLQQQKELDLERHSGQIKTQLRKEIIERYYFKAGVIESSFVHDPDILKALNVVLDKDSYNKILGINK